MKIISSILLMLILLISIQTYGIDGKIELTRDARNLSEWVSDKKDNNNLPFIIIDKKETKVFVFHPDGKLCGSTIALVGIAIGDDLSPGVGQKKIADIQIQERTTQAGRFEAQLGQNTNRAEILWIDYDSGLSMHPVVTSNPYEQRLRRLSSSKISERRITYGCINVPNHFYQEFVHSSFKNGGIVYILPENYSILNVFGEEAERYSQRE